MTDKELLTCPLLKGLDAMHRAEMIGLLNDSNLRAKLENCVARIACAEEAAKEAATPGNEPRNFEKEVHSWKPYVPVWSRSSKE